MKRGKTIIVSQNTFVIRGLMKLIHIVNPSIDIEIVSGIEAIPAPKYEESRIVHIDLDLALSPSSKKEDENLERPRDILVALGKSNEAKLFSTYFKETINPTKSEEVILDKLKQLYSQETKIFGGESSLLSEREKEVLRGVALGQTNNEISDNLHISAHTVITHRKNITAKLGIKTIAGLAIYAALNGIITSEEMESQV